MVWAVSLLTMKLIPHRLTGNSPLSIQSLSRFGTGLPARTEIVLYPSVFPLPLRLNTFRGEPASSEFDWHFTPNHTSSADFFQHRSVPDLHLSVTRSFILDMVRSPGFGSINTDDAPFSDSLSLWLRHSNLTYQYL